MSAKNSTREFPVAPLPRSAWLTLLAVPALMLLAALLVPAQGGAALPVPPWLFMLAVAGLTTALLLLALRRRRITLQGGELEVASTFYTRRVPVQQFELEKARVVDLAEHTEFKPGLKSNGFALVGFNSGHYRLRNGAKGFLLVSDTHRVLVLPQRDGRFVLLSPQKPQALLDALREEAARP